VTDSRVFFIVKFVQRIVGQKNIWRRRGSQIIWTNGCFGLKGICRQQMKRKNWGLDLGKQLLISPVKWVQNTW